MYRLLNWFSCINRTFFPLALLSLTTLTHSSDRRIGALWKKEEGFFSREFECWWGWDGDVRLELLQLYIVERWIKKRGQLKWLAENDPLETDDVEGVVCMPSRNFHIEKFLIENYFTSKMNMREEHWHENKLNAEIQSVDDVDRQFFTWHPTRKLSVLISSQFNKFLRLKDQKRPTQKLFSQAQKKHES